MFDTHKLVFKTKQRKCPFCNCNLKSCLYLYEICIAKKCKHKVCFTFENQLLNYVSMVITYLSLDELKDGTWQRMFSTLEDFENYDNGNLINKAAIYSMTLQYI